MLSTSNVLARSGRQQREAPTLFFAFWSGKQTSEKWNRFIDKKSVVVIRAKQRGNDLKISEDHKAETRIGVLFMWRTPCDLTHKEQSRNASYHEARSRSAERFHTKVLKCCAKLQSLLTRAFQYSTSPAVKKRWVRNRERETLLIASALLFLGKHGSLCFRPWTPPSEVQFSYQYGGPVKAKKPSNKNDDC